MSLEMDQQFSLSWNNFHGNLSKGFAGLLGKGEFVDVTIAVEGHLLQAHKVILSICSPYFKKMFQLNPCQHPIVVLRDISYKAMKDLLQFMYHGEVSVKREDLTSFIGTAEVLHIKGLTNKETEEDDLDSEQELPNQDSSSKTTNNKDTPINPLKIQPETLHTNHSEKTTNDNEPQNYNELLDKLYDRLNHLKRKSNDYNAHSNSFYNNDINSLEKRPKLQLKDTNSLISQNSNLVLQNNNYDHIHKMFEDRSSEASHNHNNIAPHNNESNNYNEDKNKSDNAINNCSPVECKTECEDPDLNEQSLCNSPKLFEDIQKGTMNNLVQDCALSLVVSDDKQLPVRYKYIYSRKGHKQLVHMNYVYTKHSTSHGKTSWRCVQYFSLNRCPATVETIDSMIYAINHHHNHEDSFDKLSKNNIYEMNIES